jgi:CheY-like chemotaxis protein
LLKVQKLESVGLLAGGIAHDFNNILAAILGNLSLSLLDKGLSGRTKVFLQEAEKASLRARDLTQQLLTFSKGGAPIKEVSSLVEVIKDSANFILRGTQVSCQFSFPDDLWLVEIDRGQISQVVQNIVLNASQAIAGSGIIRIACCNTDVCGNHKSIGPQDGKYVKISLSDNGIGMPANIVDKIFDPYFSTKKEGSGLGLAITHAIIAKHGGQISVDSKPGAGTTFTIYLPASSKSEASPPEQIAPPPVQRKANILIMDDDEMVRSVAKAMLTSLGHEVILTADGSEAIEVYRESGSTIDFVIMDLTIPGGMGGKDAVREILKLNPAAKVVVSSGYSNDPIMAQFGEYGFCAALVKPYQLTEFAKLINQLIH